MPAARAMMTMPGQEQEEGKRKLPIDPISAAFLAMMVGPTAFRAVSGKVTGDKLKDAIRKLFDTEMASGDPARANVEAIRAKASSREFLRANRVVRVGLTEDPATGLPQASVEVDKLAPLRVSRAGKVGVWTRPLNR